MTDSGDRKPAGIGTSEALAKFILGRAAASPAAPAPESAATLGDDPAELIDLYFLAETAAERDVVMGRIAALRDPLATHFLRTVMDNDEDDLVRLTAAAALLGGEPGAPEAALDEPTRAAAATLLDEACEDFMDEARQAHAIELLLRLRGAALFSRLLSLLDTAGDDALPIMLAMEKADGPRALATWEARLDAMGGEDWRETELEYMAASFCRFHFAPGLAALQRFAQRLSTALPGGDDRLAWLREAIGIVELALA